MSFLERLRFVCMAYVGWSYPTSHTHTQNERSISESNDMTFEFVIHKKEHDNNNKKTK